MKSRSITYTKNHFSAVVREVKEGASYLVCDHNKPVAVLSPVTSADADIDEKNLAAMEKAGLVRRGETELPPEFFSASLPRVESSDSVVDALLEERKEGR